MYQKAYKTPGVSPCRDAVSYTHLDVYKRQGLDSTTILMPDYKGKSISGRVITARKVDKSTGSKTWEWGWYVLSLIHI